VTARCRFFPRNTTAQCNTKLLERIQLEGDYEVALVELLYPQTFHNVHNSDESLYLELVQNGEVVFKYLLEGAHYDNEAVFARTLTEKFNAAISRETDVKNINVRFSFDDSTRRIKMGIQCEIGISLFMYDALKPSQHAQIGPTCYFVWVCGLGQPTFSAISGQLLM
jgi:hypothetical protein